MNFIGLLCARELWLLQSCQVHPESDQESHVARLFIYCSCVRMNPSDIYIHMSVISINI